MFTWARRKLIGAFFLSLLFGTLTRGETVLAAERILYIPLDDRPVNLAYTVDTFKKAGVDVVTPPSELLSSASRKGNPDALGNGSKKKAPLQRLLLLPPIPSFMGALPRAEPTNSVRLCSMNGSRSCSISRPVISIFPSTPLRRSCVPPSGAAPLRSLSTMRSGGRSSFVGRFAG